MSRVREIAKSLGVSGIGFLFAFLLFCIFYLVGRGLLAFCSALLVIGFGAPLLFRGLRWVKQHALWGVRNRLLCVYGLMGVLPILLILVLVGLGSWAMMNELAIYLASSALDRRVHLVQEAVEALKRISADKRLLAAPEVLKAFDHTLPGIHIYIQDTGGIHRFPPDCPPLKMAKNWKDVDGVLVEEGKFYEWAHLADADGTEITALAPLSNDVVQNLVPNLGTIVLVETSEKRGPRRTSIATSSDQIQVSGPSEDPNFTLSLGDKNSGRGGLQLPPAMGRLDVPVFWPSTRAHYHLDSPGRTFPGALWVYSRPSAVLRTFFSGTEFLRGALYDFVVVVAVLLLLVELVAVFIGVSLSRRITAAVNQLYEGTRRVIHGDFSHRIPVRQNDQLGDLAVSFNQMTGNLERLLAVEKEKERLQTELEIAREVQSQLYPKEALPASVLKLSVRCDPARMVSGDYYDYQVISRGKLAFAIGDVAGKGISAALLMATLGASLRAQMAQYQPTNENECNHLPEIDASTLVSMLNKQLYAHTSPEKYATFFFAVFDEKTRTLTYTNAGHLSPLLFRGGEVVPLDSNGTVVGAFPFSKYDESCLVMNPGDLLVCYTDGITEPENAYGEMFGEERLVELVKKHFQEDDQTIIRIVLDAVRGWTASSELFDDMTLLLAREVSAA